jgi:hypothetical protein
MPITSVHAEYSHNAARWEKNRIATSGQDAVKRAGVLFLPDDSELDRSNEARLRYARYQMRATWLPVSSYTVSGLSGMVFRLPAAQELPAELEYINDNADGAGLSLDQFAKINLDETIIVGRAAILSEFPSSEAGLSAEQVRARQLQARMTLYRAESFDNWKFELIGGVMKLTMAKLCELAEIERDEFETESVVRYRVLRLRDGVYTQEVLDDQENVVVAEFVVRMADGSAFDHIPLHLVGAENNRPEVDGALISGIVDLNTAHFQVTADQAKCLHIHSGGTLVISSSMSNDQWKEANPNGITVGADMGIFLGDSGSATLLQLEATGASDSRLNALEDQMLSVGAHLITPSTQETAEAARIDAGTKSSALLSATNNVSAAIESALKDCALFMGGNPDQVVYRLNTEFLPRNVLAAEAMSAIQLMDRGVLAMTDVRAMLRGSSYLEPGRTDEEIDSEAQEVEPIMPVVSAQ